MHRYGQHHAKTKTYFSLNVSPNVLGIPLLLVLFWVWAMEVHHEAYCWKNYSKSAYIWIILGPMIFALMVSFFHYLTCLPVTQITQKKVKLKLNFCTDQPNFST